MSTRDDLPNKYDCGLMEGHSPMAGNISISSCVLVLLPYPIPLAVFRTE